MRTKVKKLYSVRYLGCEGRGVNKKDAKQDAMERIQRTFELATTPTVLSWRGVLAILYIVRDCFEYILIHPDSAVDLCGIVQHGINIEGSDRIDALENVKHHLAQISWKPEDGTTIPFIMRGCSDKMQAEFISWERWQLAAHHARYALGMTDCNAIHRWACENYLQF